MKSVIVLLLLACLSFSQANYDIKGNLPIPQPAPAPSQQPPQNTRYGKGGNNQYWNDQDREDTKGQHELTDEQIEDIAQIVSMTVFVTVIVSIAVGGILLFKCMQKRRESQNIQEQMLSKKHAFASSMGINLYELNNNQRMTFTMHV